MSFDRLKKWVALGVLASAVLAAATPNALAEDRKAKSKVAPAYPELAKRMNVSGTVKIEVVITPAGTVKSAKAVGGHPLLIDSAMEAVKKWKFEPAGEETTQVVAFDFTRPQ
ncbi:MAG TPA: energy transducer TonB [Terriglobales bacterium]|nr:energy transducer TonB [Terriglobales bacterium]